MYGSDGAAESSRVESSENENENENERAISVLGLRLSLSQYKLGDASASVSRFAARPDQTIPFSEMAGCAEDAYEE
jgi:hypothetical protein